MCGHKIILINCCSLYFLILVLGLLHNAYSDTKDTKPYMCYLPHAADGYVEPIVWRCAGQLPLWSYNETSNECLEFRYGGCGGNDNSFYSREDCEKICKS